MPVSAVFISTDLISEGERWGYAWTSNAAEPATIGDAPDVPPNAVAPSPVPTSAETEAPGAAMPGLMALKLTLGPRLELDAVLRTKGMNRAVETVTFTVAPAAS